MKTVKIEMKEVLGLNLIQEEDLLQNNGVKLRLRLMRYLTKMKKKKKMLR